VSQKPRSSFNLIVDSGAFTAWNTGREIRLDDYCKFLDSIAHLRPFHAVQLDVFGDPAASHANLMTMQKRGYDVMPVFTRGDSLERLEEYYSMTDYIMFGGIVIGGKNQNYAKWFLNRNKGRKCHWLGFVNMPFMKKYKPESVDSSSWSGSARFGGLHLYMGGGKMKSFKKEVFRSPPSEEIVLAAARVGVKYEELRLLASDVCWSGAMAFMGDGWDRPKKAMAQFISTLSHMTRAHEIEKTLGTKVYLTGAGEQQNKHLFAAHEYLKERGIWK
jgi:hypothetical protein